MWAPGDVELVGVTDAVIACAHRRLRTYRSTSDPRVLTIMQDIAWLRGSAPNRKTRAGCAARSAHRPAIAHPKRR